MQDLLLSYCPGGVALGWGPSAWVFIAVLGPSLVVVLGLLIVETSLVAGHRLSGTWTAAVVACKLSGCGVRALERQLNSCGAQA